MQAVRRKSIDTSHTEALELVHEILVLDAFLVERLDHNRYRTITQNFVSDLLDTLRMEPLGDLGIYPAVDEREPGWSFIQPITTSHVSAHYFANPNGRPHIRIDAYSCASIDRSALIGICHRHFALEEWRASFINRQLDHPAQRSVVELSGNGGRVTTEAPLSVETARLHGDK